MTTMMNMERTGMGMGMGMMPMGGMPATMNMMMIPRCTMKMMKCDGGMQIMCMCKDETAMSMMQNLCAMLQGGMMSCGMMMNGMMMTCCNMTMGTCKCEMTTDGMCVSWTCGDAKCCEMIQACCDMMMKMMDCGCTCCMSMNNTPICCGCCC